MEELRTMERVNVVVLMDEDILHDLEKQPANKVLAMIEAAGEQVRAAVEFAKQGEEIPSELLAMVLFVEDVEVLSAVEIHGHMNPRTNAYDPDHIYLVHRFDYPPVRGESDPP